TNFWALGSLGSLAVGIFTLDLSLPLGVAVGVLYTIPVLISIWFPQKRYTLVSALLGTVFTILGIFLSPLGGILWVGLINRGLTLFIVWVTVILVLLHKQATEQIKILQGLLPICSGCKKIRDDRRAWHHLEVYIEKHSEAQFTHGLCPECVQKYYGNS
ncbi:MAG: hypothetical protein C4294_01575, partial [Nitrospiraceae bacterium]